MGTYTTKYETKDGKTRRVENTPPEAPETAAAPKKDSGADTAHTPGKPAKEGA